MQKILYILQPGRLGDIIISLPIAKWYADNGYQIIWPVMNYCHSNVADYINYVKFYPVSDEPALAMADAKKIIHTHESYAKAQVQLTLKFAFRFPFTRDETKLFEEQSLPFDEYRYQIANVPFYEKWNLAIKRNYEKEEKVLKYAKDVKGGVFSLAHLCGSHHVARFTETSKYTQEVPVPIVEVTTSIFDWIGALEQSQSIWMVDSCISNLVNQLRLQNTKYYQKENDDSKLYPVLRGTWLNA